MTRTRRAEGRRGVLLLVVLGLLLMFSLLAITLVVLTGHARRGADAARRFDQYADPPDQLVYQTLMQVLRGTNNPASVLWPHSLLEDMYGNRWALGTLTAPQAACGGQLIEFTPALAGGEPPYRWVGCVLTMLTGPAAGRSTRIVGYTPALGQPGRFQVLAFEGVATADFLNPAALAAAGGAYQYLVNGVPFSGTGIGYGGVNPRAELGEMDAAGRPYALLPNPTTPEFRAWAAGADGILGTADDRPLMANEDYDAADYQNMLLAMVLPWDSSGDGVTDSTRVPLPSLMRPELVRYWMNRADAAAWTRLPAELQRRIILRPLRAYHPNFTGSNPNFNAAWDGVTAGGGSWDVDNDGDGVPDSIWVDLGLPVRTLPDGRRYKPLAAILCVDMDGRFNLNAHGSLAQTEPPYYGSPPATAEGIPPGNGRLYADGGAGKPQLLPAEFEQYGQRGLGFGPAEINLMPLFAPLASVPRNSIPPAEFYRRLLCGVLASGPVEGRYGEGNLVGGPIYPGITGSLDPHNANKFFDYPTNFSDYSIFSGYGSPPDIMGLMSVGLDLGGQPVYSMYLGKWGSLPADNPALVNPYRIDLSASRGRKLPGAPQFSADSPFTPAELERLLRPFDRDTASLPTRLLELSCVPAASNIAQRYWLQYRRHDVTTESWDLPVPGVVGSRSSRGVGVPQHLADVVAGRLRQNGITDPAAIAVQLSLLLPPEVRAGLKMDLNRRFGDGKDDDGNGVVDEPEEAGQDNNTYRRADGSEGINVPFDLNNGRAGADPRQLYARDLYVMMMALADFTYLDAAYGGHDKAVRAMAQWAVNVVDFRDRDSIMTRFAYDADPFDGWNPPGDAHHVVWGCERPELLITETLAFHDRATQDLDNFGYAVPPDPAKDKKEWEEDPDKIKDLDQAYRPQGSLFVELYNPWPGNEPFSGDLYDAQSGGVDLARLTPDDSSGKNWPVWRLKISIPAEDPKDDPDPDDAAAERVVYFVPLDDEDSGTATPPDGDVKYFPTAAPMAGVRCGQYAVVGPGKVTYLGLRTGADKGDATTRQIVLDPTASPQVEVKNNTGSSVGKGQPLAIVIDKPNDQTDKAQPLRMSVSEPVEGYGKLLALPGNTYDAGTGKFKDVEDKPLDSKRTEEWNTTPLWEILGRNGTTTRYRMIHLQRLADPLRPYNPADPDANPYRTIDSAAVDLTCFNGAADGDTVRDYPALEPGADGAALPAGDGVMFHARQRGERNADPNENDEPGTVKDFNLWKQEPAAKTFRRDDAVGAPDHCFDKKLKESLGYVSSEYFPTGVSSGAYSQAPAPLRPYPWLTWLNRPLVSPLELLLVPTLRSSQLLKYDAKRSSADVFHYRRNYGYPRAGDPLDPYSPANEQENPYPHLLDFFFSTKSDGSQGPSPQFHRLLEFVRVPSPFNGTELEMDPAAALAEPPQHEFHPPFLDVPACREPGRVNLNTITSRDVWLGLLNQPDLSDTRVPWLEFLRSRRGYRIAGAGNPASELAEINSNYPTRFGNPFRSFAGATCVPPTGGAPDLGGLVGAEVNATLLRARVDFSGPAPLFLPEPLFRSPSATAPGLDFTNTDRNPLFRYRNLMRLGNLVTTRSNVYAVWITVGYFEVEPAPTALPGVTPAEWLTIYPEGYALGREVGIDTGEVKRHRAFYLIDRSVPVGFQRGRDLNVDRTILVNRFIE